MLNRHSMQMAILLLGLVIAVIGILISVRPSNAAGPLPSGTQFVVYIDASGNQPEPDPGPPTDMLVFTGGRTDSTEIAGCAPQSLIPHNAILVDRDGGRSSRKITVFVGEAQLIPAGTRVTGFSPAGSCHASDGIIYRKYNGMVE